jgi:hypothetical protein
VDGIQIQFQFVYYGCSTELKLKMSLYSVHPHSHAHNLHNPHLILLALQPKWNLIKGYKRPDPTHYPHSIQPLKMEPTEGSETSAALKLTPGKYPKEDIQHLCLGPSNGFLSLGFFRPQLCSVFYFCACYTTCLSPPYKNMFEGSRGNMSNSRKQRETCKLGNKTESTK